jgi:hypothetical protein
VRSAARLARRNGGRTICDDRSPRVNGAAVWHPDWRRWMRDEFSRTDRNLMRRHRDAIDTSDVSERRSRKDGPCVAEAR